MTKRVFAGGDTHCGSKVGLAPPGWWYALDGPKKNIGRQQRETWKFYQDTVERLKPFDVAIWNGDLIDGNGKRSGGTELICTDRLEQVAIAEYAMRIVDAPVNVVIAGCLTAGHRILTADLKYVPVEELREGDKLLACDENVHPETKHRYWKESVVTGNGPVKADTFTLYLSNGETITATYDHAFLMKKGSARYRWVTVEELYKASRFVDNYMNRALGRAGQLTQYMPIRFPRFMPVWGTLRTYESGYLAGFFDGEGTLNQIRKPVRTSVPESNCALYGYQNENEVLAYAESCLSGMGMAYRKYVYDKKNPNCKALAIIGGVPKILHLIGSVRPKRMLEKIEINKLGCVFNRGDNGSVEIVDIVHNCIETVWHLSTSTKTYVSEGFISHNTPYHSGQEEDYESIIAEKFDTTLHGHAFIDVDGWTFDVKHKVGSSTVPYGRHTAVAKERLWNLLWADVEGAPRADIFIRSHVHHHNYCGGPDWLAMTLPALQGMGSKYGERQCSGIVDFGFVTFDVTPEEYQWKSHLLKIRSAFPGVVKC